MRYGEQIFTCDRCGFDYPASKMMVQDGLQVCIVHCRFEKGAQYYRDRVTIPLEADPIVLEGDEEST